MPIFMATAAATTTVAASLRRMAMIDAPQRHHHSSRALLLGLLLVRLPVVNVLLRAPGEFIVSGSLGLGGLAEPRTFGVDLVGEETDLAGPFLSVVRGAVHLWYLRVSLCLSLFFPFYSSPFVFSLVRFCFISLFCTEV